MNHINHDNFIQREQETLQKIMAAGFCDPWEEFAAALQTGDNRRYIKELCYVDYGNIRENQVAESVVDKTRCKEELAPLIRRDGLKNPPIVEETSIPGIYSQVTGHHRAYTMEMLGKPIPVIVTTPNYNQLGGEVPPDIRVIQGVQANPPKRSRTYTMEDAVYVLSHALKLNPDQCGRNPSKQVPPRHSDDEFDFDDFVNRVMGSDYFPHKAIRTKIRNRLLRGTVRSKLVEIDFNEQTSFLRRINWDDGLKRNKKTRKRSGEHFDTNRNAMVVSTDNNGRHFDEKLLGIVKVYHSDADFRRTLASNKIQFIDISARIYRPSTDKASLDTARATFKKAVSDWNSLLPKMNVGLTIRYLAFPKQLKGSDADKLYKV